VNNEYEAASERMMRTVATKGVLFRSNVVEALSAAHVPQAETGWDDELGFYCTHSGYSFPTAVKEGGKVIDIAIIGRTGVPDEVRQGERDALIQQTRAALDAAGIEVRISGYGHITAVNR
jgi:hypothetical protein